MELDHDYARLVHADRLVVANPTPTTSPTFALVAEDDTPPPPVERFWSKNPVPVQASPIGVSRTPVGFTPNLPSDPPPTY